MGESWVVGGGGGGLGLVGRIQRRGRLGGGNALQRGITVSKF